MLMAPYCGDFQGLTRDFMDNPDETVTKSIMDVKNGA